MPPLAAAPTSPLDLTSEALLSHALQEIDHLRAALASASRDHASSSRALAQLADDNRALREAQRAQGALIVTLQRDLVTSAHDLSSLQRDLSATCIAEGARADALALHADALAARADAEAAAASTLSASLHQLSAQRDADQHASAERITQLTTALNEERSLRDQQHQDLQTARADLERLRERLDRTKAERDEAREQALDQRRRCAQLERDLQQTSLSASDLQRRLDTLLLAPPTSHAPPAPAPVATPQHTPLTDLKPTLHSPPTSPSHAPSSSAHWSVSTPRALDPLAERVALDERLRLAHQDLLARDERIRSLELQLDQLRLRLRRLQPPPSPTA